MTLLTPAVLHCSALEYLADQPSDFHRRYLLRFGFMQGIWTAIFFIAMVALLVMPNVAVIRETGMMAFTNANFTHCRVENGVLSVDMKPSIWTYTVSDSRTHRQEIVVDTTGSLNRFYWDDRVEQGNVKKVDGVGFMKEYVFLKKGAQMKRIPYRAIGLSQSNDMTKGEVYERFLQITRKENLALWAAILLPVVLLVGSVIGMLYHGLYILLFGTVLRILTAKFVPNMSAPYRVASGLYVGWSYVMVLGIIAQQVLHSNNMQVSGLFFIVNAVGLVGTLAVGYLCLRIRQTRPLAASITKVTRRAR